MIAYELIRDKPVAMLVWNVDAENDVRVFTGKIMEHEDELLFTDEAGNWRITVTDEIYQRIKPVPAGLEQILHLRWPWEHYQEEAMKILLTQG